MRGVYFDNYHTVIDWGLILSSKSIDPPTPKIVKVNIDGRDGTLDLSRALTGDMKFDNRGASFSFLVTEGSQLERENMIRDIINAIHGKRLNIIEPDDLDHYFIGECTISDVYNNKSYGSFTVTAECDPYRYSVNETIRRVELSATTKEIVLTNNGRRTLVPTITVTGSVNLVFGTTSASLSAGTHKLASLALKNGATVLKVSGSGTVSFAYREAML